MKAKKCPVCGEPDGLPGRSFGAYRPAWRGRQHVSWESGILMRMRRCRYCKALIEESRNEGERRYKQKVVTGPPGTLGVYVERAE